MVAAELVAAVSFLGAKFKTVQELKGALTLCKTTAINVTTVFSSVSNQKYGKGFYTGAIDANCHPEGEGKWVIGTTIVKGSFHKGKAHGSCSIIMGDISIAGQFSQGLGTLVTCIVGKWQYVGPLNGAFEMHGTGSVSVEGEQGGYNGAFMNGKQTGQGTYQDASGFQYHGEWQNGRLMNGRKHWPGGAGHYQGSFKAQGERSIREGQGTMTLANGTTFSGKWKDDQFMSGTVAQNDCTYVGNLKDGVRNGYGTLVKAGHVYEGQWVDDVKEGLGKQTWPDGCIYYGNWKGGLHNGEGKMTWASGQVWSGEWKNGEKNGHGILTASDGTKCKGVWVADVRQLHC